MKSTLLALLMSVVLANDGMTMLGETNLGDDPVKVGIMVNNGRLWGLLIFLFLVLKVAWMINVDNAPDTQKDSILYAKFLTNRVEKNKMD